MIRLEVQHIINLHNDITEESGGVKDILNIDSLEGSVFSLKKQ